jgi:ABC-type sugar transport system ATPase subunit
MGSIPIDRTSAGSKSRHRSVYEQPANVFVAGFIGSPGMSFATMRAARNGGSLTLSRGEVSFTLDATRRPIDGVPAEVIVGVRPEHARLWREGGGLVGPIAGRAEFVEMLGARDVDRGRDRG